MTAVNKIITDAGTPKDELDELKKLGIEIIVAPRPDETGGVAGAACDLKQVIKSLPAGQSEFKQ
ncbi:MAG TPA: hypothetical protein GXX35_13305 [Thermoanaerobacterales bacterium]|nr:hypothetical protein [Thermoanaerobacterales bacterium]